MQPGLRCAPETPGKRRRVTWGWRMGGAIFKLGKNLSEFISTLSAGGGKGPIVQGSREGGRGRGEWHNSQNYVGVGRPAEGGGGDSPSQLAS